MKNICSVHTHSTMCDGKDTLRTMARAAFEAGVENLQRENLSPLEEAAGYMRLKTEFRMKQGDIAKDRKSVV